MRGYTTRTYNHLTVDVWVVGGGIFKEQGLCNNHASGHEGRLHS